MHTIQRWSHFIHSKFHRNALHVSNRFNVTTSPVNFKTMQGKRLFFEDPRKRCVQKEHRNANKMRACICWLDWIFALVFRNSIPNQLLIFIFSPLINLIWSTFFTCSFRFPIYSKKNYFMSQCMPIRSKYWYVSFVDLIFDTNRTSFVPFPMLRRHVSFQLVK